MKWRKGMLPSSRRRRLRSENFVRRHRMAGRGLGYGEFRDQDAIGGGGGGAEWDLPPGFPRPRNDDRHAHVRIGRTRQRQWQHPQQLFSPFGPPGSTQIGDGDGDGDEGLERRRELAAAADGPWQLLSAAALMGVVLLCLRAGSGKARPLRDRSRAPRTRHTAPAGRPMDRPPGLRYRPGGGGARGREPGIFLPQPTMFHGVQIQFPIDFSELKLMKVIGGGAFGQVWKATWRGTPVAVKVLAHPARTDAVPKSVLEKFASEIEMISGMSHPNICLFMGACLNPPNLAIVTEFASHGSVWDALRSPLDPPYTAADGVTRNAWPLSLYRSPAPGPMAGGHWGWYDDSSMSKPSVAPAGAWPWVLVKRVASGVARAMTYLHNRRRPVLHRDLKSANLLLDDSYAAKVADFGLSRIMAQERSMTRNCGTVQWMAPEILGNQKYAEPADVYSFGIILWELLTRECPFEGMSPIQCALAVLNENARPETPDWCPPGLAALIRSCVNKDPSARPSFPQILSALDAMP